MFEGDNEVWSITAETPPVTRRADDNAENYPKIGHIVDAFWNACAAACEAT